MAAQQTFAFFQADNSAPQPTRKNAGKRTTSGRSTAGKSAPRKLAKQLDSEAVANAIILDATTPRSTTDNDTSEPLSGQVALGNKTVSETVSKNQTVLEKLRAQVGCVSTASSSVQSSSSTGCQALDSMLPNNGIRVDALTEWVADSDSSGAAVLAMIAATTHLSDKQSINSKSRILGARVSGPLVIVDTQRNFYPPAAVALGISADQIFVVRPNSNADAVWAIDQALRCDAVGAVWAHVGSWLDDRDARRFQLAAETGKTPGLFVRPKRVRGRPSFADIRFFVQGIGSQNNQVHSSSFAAKITIDRCRGGTVGKEMSLQINDQARIEPLSTDDSIYHKTATARHETAVMHLASQLADTASKSSAASSNSGKPAAKHSA